MFDLNSALLTIFICGISLFFFLFLFSNSTSKSLTTRNPCPQSYPIIGNLPGFLRNRNRFHDWVVELLTQTPASTLQVNTFFNISRGVCTANPANVQHLLLSNFPNYIKGSRYTAVLDELLGDGIFNIDGSIWTLQRKIASHEFNTKSLKYFISDVVKAEISERLLPFLTIASDDDSVIDLQKVLETFTFNNICNVAFGVDPATMEDSYFVEAFNDAVEICSSRFMSPFPYLWKMRRFLNIEPEKLLAEVPVAANNNPKTKNLITHASRTYQPEGCFLWSIPSITSSNECVNRRQPKCNILRGIPIKATVLKDESWERNKSMIYHRRWQFPDHQRSTPATFMEYTRILL